MANAWLRLWHDMPNDPKWRTIAKASGQSIALVQAVYLQLLVSASQNESRDEDENGVTSRNRHATVTNEDIASSLDVTIRHVDSVTEAMQGRVLDGRTITGWANRQQNSTSQKINKKPPLTDAERAKRYRDKKKSEQNASRNVTENHVTSRDGHGVTTQIREEENIKDQRESNAREPPVDNFGEPEPVKFRMHADWQPVAGFSERSRSWGHNLGDPPHTAAELRQFRDYWSQETVERHHQQWEMAFAESLDRQKSMSRSTRQERDINEISPVDTHIPPGFRGYKPGQEQNKHERQKIGTSAPSSGDNGTQTNQDTNSNEKQRTERYRHFLS